MIPRNPEQPIAMAGAAVQVVVVRRQPAIGIVVADDRIERQPAEKAVDVEARLEAAAPEHAIRLRRIQRGDRALDVGPVLVELVRLLREVVLVEDRPASTGAVRLVQIAVSRLPNSASSIGRPGTSIIV